MKIQWNYYEISNISHTKSQNLKWFLSHLAVVFAQSIEARFYVQNEDVVGAVPTGDAPTTFEWSIILLPIKVQLILEVWRYFMEAAKVSPKANRYVTWWPLLALLSWCPVIYSQVSSTHLKIGQFSSMGALSSNELQWLDIKIGQQDSSPGTCNGCRGYMPYCLTWLKTVFTIWITFILALVRDQLTVH